MTAFTRSQKRKASEDSFLVVLQCLAENCWLPDWWEQDYEHLRLVSTATKILVDDMVGPDFESIVVMLNLRNGLNRESGACHYCSENRVWGGWSAEKCQTCVAANGSKGFFDACHCTELHQFDPVLLEKDPRMKSNFAELPSREQAKLLLRFCRFCTSNFLQRFENPTRVDEANDGDIRDELSVEGLAKFNLTLVEPNFLAHEFGDFGEQLLTYNRPIFNFIHNLLMIGMSVNDLGFFNAKSTSPWDIFSPWRKNFLHGQTVERDDWDYEHDSIDFSYHEHMVDEFLQAHEPADDEEIVITYGDEEGEGLTASQIRYIPRVLYHCVVNSNDKWAEELLGPRIAASIDFYRPAWMTLCENDIALNWMPCLGGEESDYEPPDEFLEGYKPRRKLIGYACGLDMYSYD